MIYFKNIAKWVITVFIAFSVALQVQAQDHTGDHQADSLDYILDILTPYGPRAVTSSLVVSSTLETSLDVLVTADSVLASAAGLRGMKAELMQEMVTEEASALLLGMSGTAMQAMSEAKTDIEARADMFDRLLSDLEQARAIESVGETETALRALAVFMEQYQRQTMVSPLKMPEQVEKATVAAGLGATVSTPQPQAALRSSFSALTSAEYLSESDEIKLVPEIVDLANSLDGDVIRIFNWVHDNIEHLPTQGAMQDAHQTLVNQQGNAYDTSSLLIALLRAANISSRYVTGIVTLQEEQITNWLGVDSISAAIELLAYGGIPHTALVSGGRPVAIRFQHIWVEAYVDFLPSRGAKNFEPDTWIALDASFKQRSIIPAVDLASVPAFDIGDLSQQLFDNADFDPVGSLSNIDLQVATDLIQDYQATVVSAAESQRPDSEIADLSDQTPVIPLNAPLLPAGLPYRLDQRTAEFSAIPESLQYRIEITLFGSERNIGFDIADIRHTIAFSELGMKRLGVEYTPASQSDADQLEGYRVSNAASLRPYTISVLPEIQIDDQMVARGGAVSMGSMQFWKVRIVGPHSGIPNNNEPYQITAGTHLVFSVNGAGVTPAQAQYAESLLPEPDVSIGQFLHQAGQIYWTAHDAYDDLTARGFGGKMMRMPSVAAFYSPLKVRYFFGIPRTGFYNGYITDAKTVNSAAIANNNSDRAAMVRQAGIFGSYFEGAVWETLTGDESGSSAASTASILMAANESGIPIYSINRENAAQIIPLLNLTQASKSEIQFAVSQGRVVITPQSEVTLNSGLAAEGYIVTDPTTGAGLYRIDGALNGAIFSNCLARALNLRAILNRMVMAKFLEIVSKKLAKRLTLGGLAAVGLKLASGVGVALVIADAVAIGISMIVAVHTVMRTFAQDVAEGRLDRYVGAAAASAATAVCQYMSSCRGKKNRKRKGRLSGLFSSHNGPHIGNPVAVGNGSKFQIEEDYIGVGEFPLEFSRIYDSKGRFGGSHGAKWRHSYERRLEFSNGVSAISPDDIIVINVPDSILVIREDGSFYPFTVRNGALIPPTDVPEKLTKSSSGWLLLTEANEVEEFDEEGKLISITDRTGQKQSLVYDSEDRLSQVTDTFGRRLLFSYNADGTLAQVTDPANETYSYQYDTEGRLTGVRYPNNTTRTYLYEDGEHATSITGIRDERGNRTFYKYDYLNRVIETSSEDGIESYTLDYGRRQTTVVDGLGLETTYNYTVINDSLRLASISEPCTSGCSTGDIQSIGYDGSGFAASVTDFNGNRTTYNHNARGLLSGMTEAAGSSVARSYSNTWDSEWYLPSEIREPGATGSNVVTSLERDEFGNILSRTITVDGESRIWNYTYNSVGLMLTEDGPRTDVVDVTTYTYDSQGNMSTMTNALGHQTRYLDYDAHGRVGRIIDQNSIETTYNYDRLSRMVASTTSGEVTQYTYDAKGNLELLTLPDNSFLRYTYDGADRLTGISDNLGNRVNYELDNKGNRIGEQSNDPAGSLVETMTRVFNNRSRLTDQLGAESQRTVYSYDGNGNEIAQLDPNSNLAGSAYDALDRLNVLTDPDNNTIRYAYDNSDNLIQVTDPRGLDTTYVYNGFDEQVSLNSPDTGTTTYQYDAASNLVEKLDNRGEVAAYAYDPLNRVTQIQYSDETIDFTYDQNANGVGRLSSINDHSGSTSYTYDSLGRVTDKRQNTNGQLLQVAYDYNAGGQMEGMTTPSGAAVAYGYAADGRINRIDINGITVVQGVEYFPFGEAQRWVYGVTDNYTYERSFDQDGRVSSYTAGQSSESLGYDLGSRITSKTSAVPSGPGWQYSYDKLDRLTQADDSQTSQSLSWEYDETGNRTQQTKDGVAIPYVIDPQSNRLAAIDGLARSYDAVGNTVDDGNSNPDLSGNLVSTYNGRNRLVETAVTGLVVQYRYNGLGERVRKVNQQDASSSRLYVYDESGHLLGEYDLSGDLIQETIWLDDTPVVTIRTIDSGNGNNGDIVGQHVVFYVQSDHLNTPRHVVNGENEIVWQWQSDPFGEALVEVDPDQNSELFQYNLRFPGQVYDEETDTHYNYFRDYDAGTGRYVQSDPIGLSDGPNTYSYVKSTPNFSIDPTGESRRYGQISKVGSTKIPKCKRCNGVDKRSFKFKGLKNVYEIYDPFTGQIRKVGVGSGASLTRCRAQLFKLRVLTSNRNWQCRSVGYVCGTYNAERLEFSRQLDLRMRGHSLPGNQPKPRPR